MKKHALQFDFFSIFVILGILLLVVLTVTCDVIQNEKNRQLNEANRAYDSAVNEGVRLQIEIDRRSDFFSVEQYATEELGMHKLEKYQIQYIRYDVTGTAELLNREEDEDFFGQVSKAFSAIGDFFAD